MGLPACGGPAGPRRCRAGLGRARATERPLGRFGRRFRRDADGGEHGGGGSALAILCRSCGQRESGWRATPPPRHSLDLRRHCHAAQRRRCQSARAMDNDSERGRQTERGERGRESGRGSLGRAREGEGGDQENWTSTFRHARSNASITDGRQMEHTLHNRTRKKPVRSRWPPPPHRRGGAGGGALPTAAPAGAGPGVCRAVGRASAPCGGAGGGGAWPGAAAAPPAPVAPAREGRGEGGRGRAPPSPSGRRPAGPPPHPEHGGAEARRRALGKDAKEQAAARRERAARRGPRAAAAGKGR